MMDSIESSSSQSKDESIEEALRADVAESEQTADLDAMGAATAVAADAEHDAPPPGSPQLERGADGATVAGSVKRGSRSGSGVRRPHRLRATSNVSRTLLRLVNRHQALVQRITERATVPLLVSNPSAAYGGAAGGAPTLWKPAIVRKPATVRAGEAQKLAAIEREKEKARAQGQAAAAAAAAAARDDEAPSRRPRVGSRSALMQGGRAAGGAEAAAAAIGGTAPPGGAQKELGGRPAKPQRKRSMSDAGRHRAVASIAATVGLRKRMEHELPPSVPEHAAVGPGAGGGPRGAVSPGPESEEARRQRSLAEAKAIDARQVPSVPEPESKLLTLDELYPRGPEYPPNWRLLKEHMRREGRLEKAAAKRVLVQVKKLMAQEDTLLDLRPPLVTVGDVHGQYYDLLELFARAGWPDARGTRYLFLGDYVDRGTFGCESFLLLAALKLCFPDKIFLLRGNHESRVITASYNFKDEVKLKYDLEIYYCFILAFDTLPLTALVTTKIGRFLCLHGGLSPHLKTLADINELDRFGEVPKSGALCDLVWADPLGDWTADQLDAAEMKDWFEVGFENNPDRGCSYLFGWQAVKLFLEENNLVAVVRAHEVQKEGYLFHWFRQVDRKIPPVITVFSAPNYCDMYHNKGAYFLLKDSGYEFVQLAAVEHPHVLPKFQNAISYTLPFIVEHIARLVEDVANLPTSDMSDEEQHQYYNRIKVMRSMRELRDNMNRIRSKSVAGSSFSSFEDAFTGDRKTDYARPGTGANSVWRSSHETLLHTLEGHSGAVFAVKFSRNGQYCVSCSQDKTLKLWNPRKGTLIKTYAGAHGFEVNDLAISPDNSRLLSGGGDRAVFVWDVATGRVVRQLRGHVQRIHCLAFNQDASVCFSGGYDKTVRAWDLRSNARDPIQSLSEARDSVMSVLVGPTEIVTGSLDGCCRIYDIRQGQLRVDDVDEPVSGVALSHDDNCLLLACLDSRLRLLDKETGELLNEYSGHEHSQYQVGASLSLDDAFVVAGSETGEILYWDLVEGHIAKRIKAHKKSVCGIAVQPTIKPTAEGGDYRNLLVTASLDSTVKVWV